MRVGRHVDGAGAQRAGEAWLGAEAERGFARAGDVVELHRGVLQQYILRTARGLSRQRERLVDVARRQLRAGSGREFAKVGRGDGDVASIGQLVLQLCRSLEQQIQKAAGVFEIHVAEDKVIQRAGDL